MKKYAFREVNVEHLNQNQFDNFVKELNKFYKKLAKSKIANQENREQRKYQRLYKRFDNFVENGCYR